MVGLAAASDAVAAYRPRRLPGRRRLGRAAVSVVLADGEAIDGLSVLLVRRAHRAGDPWSGDMALPGGRQAADDTDNLACALRETREETSLRLARRDCIGRLSDRVTCSHRYPLPMVVSSYVCRQTAASGDICHSAEIAETLWLPLQHLREPANRARLRWRVGPLSLQMPCCDYRGRRIWGLTLMILDELLRALDQDRR